MYPPGNKNANHRKGYCADGAPSVYKGPVPTADGQEIHPNSLLPEWPQPQGIFKAGNTFDPTRFLLAVRDLYEKVADHEIHNPGIAFEYSLEDQAFSRMLQARAIPEDGHTYFWLYDLTFTTGSAHESLVAEIDGKRCLRMDCL